jgi:hypothetical protein
MRTSIWLLAILGLSLTAALAQESIVGTWACQSFASGAYTGRKCPLEPWLTIAPETYEWGREKGKWTYTGKVFSLSGRVGTGRINAAKISFSSATCGANISFTAAGEEYLKTGMFWIQTPVSASRAYSAAKAASSHSHFRHG